MKVSPVVGDGVAHKDHSGIGFAFNNPFVVGPVSVKTEPILRITPKGHHHE
jgi:hypothetical protein